MSKDVLEQLRSAIASLDAEKAREAAKTGVSSGVDPLTMINQGIRGALEWLGERFSSGDLFLPELMLAAKAADAAVSVLEPELLKRGGTRERVGKVLLATVAGDIHDIGKNIVALVMKSAGFEVVDIGTDKQGREILEAAKKHEVDVIGLSALLTTTMLRMREFVELLQESGLRDRFKVILGGAPVTQEFCDTIGADGYAADAPRGVELTRRVLGK